MFQSSPFLGQVPLRPPTMGCGGGFIPAPLESDREEQQMVMGCDEHRNRFVVGCAKCKRKKKPDWTLETQSSSEMVGTYRTERHGRLAGRRLGQGAVCTVKPPVITAETNCQLTEGKDIICSNGVIYSGTCPNAPTVNYPGIAPNKPGTTTPQAPPYMTPEEAATGPGAPLPAEAAPPMPNAPTAPSKSLPVVGIVAGGLVVVGLTYLLLR